MFTRAFAIIAMVSLGCQPTEPTALLDGEYLITSVSGRELPALLFEDQGGWKVVVLEGRLTIDNKRYHSTNTHSREVDGEIEIVEGVGRGYIVSRYGITTMQDDTPGIISTLTREDDGSLLVVPELVSVTIRYERVPRHD